MNLAIAVLNFYIYYGNRGFVVLGMWVYFVYGIIEIL